jgi:membrane-associated phospholipid phosphatase
MLQPALDSSRERATGPGARPTARPWVVTWAIVAALLIALLSFRGYLDQITWCATRDALGPNTRFYRATSNLWLVLKSFGEPWMIVLMAVFVGVYDRRRWLMAGSFVMAVLLAGGLAALLRILDGRYRPTHINGGWQWEWFRGFHDGTDLSFPSGHATAAFAAAAVFSYLSPKGRFFFVAVAAGTAISRVIAGAHFYSDVLLGGALGWTVGWFVFSLLCRLLPRPTGSEASEPTPPHC